MSPSGSHPQLNIAFIRREGGRLVRQANASAPSFAWGCTEAVGRGSLRRVPPPTRRPGTPDRPAIAGSDRDSTKAIKERPIVRRRIINRIDAVQINLQQLQNVKFDRYPTSVETPKFLVLSTDGGHNLPFFPGRITEPKPNHTTDCYPEKELLDSAILFRL